MKKKKNLICYFKKGDAPGSLKLHTIDIKTKLKIDKHSYEILPENVLNFFINAPKFIKISTKAVIFNQIYDFENSSFHDSNEFIRIIFTRFEDLNIPIRLIDGKTFTITILLIAAKINPKLDRNILFILISDDTIFYEEIYRTKEGYSYPATKKTQSIQCSVGYDPKKIKEEIYSNINQKPYEILLSAINMLFLIFWIPILFYGYDPEKIKDEILEYVYSYKICIAEFSTFSKNILDDMLNVFGVDKYLTIDDKIENETIAEIALQLFDNKHNRYYIIPRFSFIVSNTEYFGRIGFIYIMSWSNDKGIPFKESFMDQRNHGRYCITTFYNNQKDCEFIDMLPFLEGKYHKINLTFEVDINLKPSFTQKSCIDPAIKSLPKTLTDKMDSKIPVIGFFDNSSVICFWNEKEKCYKFSDKWNGLYGEDLYISFDKKKPKFRNEAYKVFKKKPTFVVFDLIKVLTSKTDYVSPLWQFAITKDEENQIYIEFDNFDGSRKHAPPELLMALLIKDHLKIIKEEIGEKPVEIGFIFFDKCENEEFYDYSLLLEKIEESCNLLKIGCKTVEI